MSSEKLNALAQAFAVHPRTILRITSGLPNPYWAEGYDTDIDLDLVVLMLQTTHEAIGKLLEGTDKALDVHEAAKMLKMKEPEFYRMNMAPDWQVGRVKRFSLRRLGAFRRK